MISVLGGFLSGFVGLGGAVVISPLLLLLPPVFGFEEIPMRAVAGLSMMQVFFGSVSGTIVHRANKFINNHVFLYVGIPLAVSALIGSYISKFLSHFSVMVMFDFFIILSFILLIKEKKQINDEASSKEMKFHKGFSILLGTITGIISGIIGAGGGIIMIPAFLKIFKLSFKTAIGTSLAIVFMGSFFGAIGKIISLQVDYKMALPIIIGSVIAARFGAKVNKITPQKVIRVFLLFIILLSILQVSYKIFTQFQK